MCPMADSRALRISRIKLRHYRSVGTCDLRLSNMSFFVGPNGSGKSNVVDSLKFVSQALRENLDNALRQRGGVTEVRRRSNGHPRHFSIELKGNFELYEFTYRFSVGSAAGKAYRITEEFCEIKGGDPLDTSRVTFHVKDNKFSENTVGVSPHVHEDRLALPILSGASDLLRELFESLSSIEVYSSAPEAMKSPQTPDLGERLLRDGSNIASVIHYISTHTPERLEEIQELLSKIVPGIKSVERIAAGSWETLEFKQEVSGAENAWRFPATSVSDGTLRALGVLTAIFAPPVNGIFSPVVIEEPETALHPAAAGVLLEALSEASKTRQVLVTSHSPDLLDSPEIRTEQVFAVRSIAGNTRVNILDQVGQEALRHGLFTVGALLRVDQLQPEEGEIIGQGELL